MYGVLDYFDPVQNPVNAPNSYSYVESQCAYDSQNESHSVLDWSHITSVTESIRDEYYVMSVGNLDAIVAFDVGGEGLAWSFSSQSDMRNDFNFSSEEDKFYNPTGAYIIEDKQTVRNESRLIELLVFDGGRNRPGCMRNFTGCYSRAIEYLLDLDKGVATVTWEFAYPYEAGEDGQAAARHHNLFVKEGGSVIRRADDANEEPRAFVGFPGTTYSQTTPAATRDPRGRQGRGADRGPGPPRLLGPDGERAVPRDPVQVHLRRDEGLAVAQHVNVSDSTAGGGRAARRRGQRHRRELGALRPAAHDVHLAARARRRLRATAAPGHVRRGR